MITRIVQIFGLVVGSLITGCATVDPTADYNRTVSIISMATGSQSVYRPEHDEQIDETVENLLSEGLTIDEAVQICLLNNPRLQAAFYRIGVAHADVVQSQLWKNPSLGVSSRFPSGGGLVNIEGQLAGNIVDLWQIPIRKKIAERKLNQTVLQIAHLASQLAVDTKIAYYQALANQHLFEIASQNKDTANQLVELAKAMREAGAASSVDVNLSQSEFQETRLAIQQASLNMKQSQMNLARILGLRHQIHPLKLTDSFSTLPEFTMDIAEVLTLAAKNRLDIAAAKEELSYLLDNIRLEKNRVFPVLEIGIEFERESRPRSSDGRFISKTVLSSISSGGFSLPSDFGSHDDEAGVTVGPSLSLELPIFDQNQAQIAKAVMIHSEAIKQFRNLLIEVTFDARFAYEKVLAARITSATYQQDILPLRESNLELSKEAYRAGKTPLITVLNTQKTLQDARAGLIQAIRDNAIAWVELERVVASPVKNIIDSADQAEQQKDNSDEN